MIWFYNEKIVLNSFKYKFQYVVVLNFILIASSNNEYLPSRAIPNCYFLKTKKNYNSLYCFFLLYPLFCLNIFLNKSFFYWLS